MEEKKFSRVIVVAPTRSTCLNISMVLSNGAIPQTLLMREKRKEIFEAVDCLELGGFGVVAGTGTGKTVAIRDIANRVLGENLSVDVITREHEATDRTWQCNTLVVTPGVALNWFKSHILSSEDLLVFDEIHQTSEHLELTLALAKRVSCTFIWMSATIDPSLYSDYLGAATVIECSAFDPSKRAEVECRRDNPEDFFSDERLDDFIAGERAVAVFVPTRAMAEKLSREYGKKDGLYCCDFYHGGEKAEKLRQFLKGDVPKPFMVFMTIAGASSLNILGLDTVVIADEMYKGVVHSGVSVLEKIRLGNNELLQMGGRVNGRMENSRVYILTSREIDFHSLQPMVPEFVLGGDLRRVALTCAKLGVNASDLDLISKIETTVYNTEVQRFRNRGIIEVESESLTPYGKKVERLPVDPGWAELIVNAEQVGDEMLNVVATCSCAESLYLILRKFPKLEGLGVSGSDHLTAYNIVVSALRQFGFVQKSNGGTEYGFRGDWVKKHFDKKIGQSEKSMGEFAQWCDFMGFNSKAIKEVAIAMKSVFRQLGQSLPDPMEMQVVSNNDHLHLGFIGLLARVQSLDFVHDQQNSKAMSAYGTVWSAQTSMTQARRVLGKIRYWTDKRGTRRATIEGTEIPEDLVPRYGQKTPQCVTRVTNEGVEIQYRLSFAEEDLGTKNIVVSDDEVPEGLLGQAEMKFVEAFANKQLSGVEVVVDKNTDARKEHNHLWIRSGGSYKRATLEDEREGYANEILGKGIISAQSFEQALRNGSVDAKNLLLVSVSDSEREWFERENPESIEVDGKNCLVEYGQIYHDTFFARVRFEKEFLFSTQIKEVFLPSGRQLEIACSGWYAMTVSELVAKLLTSDCSEELRVPQTEPWQKKTGYWGWSLTDLGKQLKSGLEKLICEHAEKPKADGMAGRIEALKQAVALLYKELAGQQEIVARKISETETELFGLIAEVADSGLDYSLRRQVSDGVEKAHKSEYGAIDEICKTLTEIVKNEINSWREREEERRKQSEADREWAISQNLPESLVSEVVERGDFSALKKFIQNVDTLNAVDLDEHTCLGCGRDRRRSHLEEISGLDSYDFFQGFDPNDVTVWIWNRLEGKRPKISAGKPKEKRPVASSKGEFSNNPFAALANLKVR